MLNSAPILRFSAQAAEVRALAAGLRQAWRLRLRTAEVEPFRQACRGHGLQVAVTAGGWSTRVAGALQPASAGPNSAHLAVVAREVSTAQHCLDDELALHELNTRSQVAVQLTKMVQAHRRLGAAYGYPACCVEAFCDAFCEVVATARAGDNPLAIARAAQRSVDFDPLLQTLTTELGEQNASPLRHLPCRFDCGASQKLALALVDPLSVTAQPHHKIVVFPDGELLLSTAPCAAHANGDWQLAGDGAVHLRGLPPPDQRSIWQRMVSAGFEQLIVVRGRGVVVITAGQRRSFRLVGAQIGGNLMPVVLPFASGPSQAPRSVSEYSDSLLAPSG